MIKLIDLLEGKDDWDHQRALDQTGFWGKRGAGAIFLAKKTGRLLIAHRSKHVEQPGTWGTWGGAIDLDETPKDAVEREVREESGYNGRFKLVPLYVFKSGTFQYHNFLVMVDEEFTPRLDWENQGYEWVEYGNWPEPMHFGLKELIQHSGNEIKKYVDMSDQDKELFMESPADVPPPPAIVQKAETFSPDFINFVKNIENANRVGYQNGKWYPHKSYEGGLPTIAWGHKIKSTNEVRQLMKGLTDSQAEKLLRDDLEIARKEVDNYMKSLGVNIPLSQKQLEMLTEFAFNLGSLKKFPKFTRAVLNQDWETAEKESLRYSKGQPLTRRNELFRKRYFK